MPLHACRMRKPWPPAAGRLSVAEESSAHTGRLPKFRCVILCDRRGIGERLASGDRVRHQLFHCQALGSPAFMKKSVCLIIPSLFSFPPGGKIGSQDISSRDDPDQFILGIHDGNANEIARAQHVDQCSERRFRPD